MSTRAFFHVSAGIFLLVAAYTLGARHAGAGVVEQSSGPVVAFAQPMGVVTSQCGPMAPCGS